MTARTEQRPSSEQVCHFLSEYASWLLGCGATCIRLEMNLTRIAMAFGKNVELYITPRHIHLSVTDTISPALKAATCIVSVRHIPTSFNINTRLSRLSWEIADRKTGFKEAEKYFRQIVSNDIQSKALVLMLVSVANASFCRLFGGDSIAMATTGIATLAGYYIKQRMLSLGIDLRATVFVCSFVSVVIAASGSIFHSCPSDIALATSVLYLIPGVPFLNSFSDMLYRYYICALSRFMDALVITACLSAGMCCGMLLMNAGMF